MKIPPRHWVPVALAALGIIGLGAFFLWETKTSLAVIEQAAQSVKRRGSEFVAPLLSDEGSAVPIDVDAQALSLLRQGEVLVLQGELKQAEEKFAESVASGGGVPAMRKLIAVQLQRRNYRDARSTLGDLRDENVSRTDADFLDGLISLREGDAPDAQRTFESIATSAQGQYGLALIAISAGNHESARELLSKVAQGTEPQLRTSARTLIEAYEEFALFPSGQAIHLDTLLARALASVQECEVALPLAGRAVSVQEDYRDAWIVKGYCELVSERTAEALGSLERAYNIDPEKPETQYFLARTYFLLGDPRNAVTFLQYAILNGFTPESDARLLLARYALELGNTELALEQYKALTEKENADVSAFRKYIDLAVTIPAHTEDAYELAMKAASKWPQDAAVQIMVARTELATNRRADAEKRLNSVLDAHPANTEARGLLEQMRK